MSSRNCICVGSILLFLRSRNFLRDDTMQPDRHRWHPSCGRTGAAGGAAGAATAAPAGGRAGALASMVDSLEAEAVASKFICLAHAARMYVAMLYVYVRLCARRVRRRRCATRVAMCATAVRWINGSTRDRYQSNQQAACSSSLCSSMAAAARRREAIDAGRCLL